MSLGDLVDHLEEEKDDDDDDDGNKTLSNQENWDKQREQAIIDLGKNGKEHHLLVKDVAGKSEVKLVDEKGTEEWDEGLKYPQSVFDLKWQVDSEKRKKLNFKWVTEKNDAGKEEKFAFVFEHEEGVKKFKMFRKKSNKHEREAGDSVTNTAEEQEAAFDAINKATAHDAGKGPRMLISELGTGTDVKSAKEAAREKKKRRLEHNDSTSTEDSRHAARAPLLKLGASPVRKKKKSKKKEESDDDILPSGSPAAASDQGLESAAGGEAFDKPKGKTAQAFHKGCQHKLSEVKIATKAFQEAKSMDDVSEKILANCIRALSGKQPKITQLHLVHTARAYKNNLHKLRAFLMIAKAVIAHLSDKGPEKQPLQMISKATELLTSFATFDAAKAVSQG